MDWKINVNTALFGGALMKTMETKMAIKYLLTHYIPLFPLSIKKKKQRTQRFLTPASPPRVLKEKVGNDSCCFWDMIQLIIFDSIQLVDQNGVNKAQPTYLLVIY